MMQLTPATRILVCVDAVDFRAGIDGLCRVCREVLGDPFSGAVFVFRNRRATAIKLLAYDGQGFWLCQKRLSAGRFRHWPNRAGTTTAEMVAHELQVLVMGGDPTATRAAPMWRSVQPSSPA